MASTATHVKSRLARPFTILLRRLCCLTGKLRIWGSGVRISSGAPFKSNTWWTSPFERERLKRFFKR